MSNYDLDEDERRERQWDAQTQSYVIVKEVDEVNDWLSINCPEVELSLAVPKEVDECYEDEEVTNPKHYDNVGFAIQPIEYITKNELDFLEGNVIKYVSRYPHKGGVNDLLKAKTYIEFLITRERERE